MNKYALMACLMVIDISLKGQTNEEPEPIRFELLRSYAKFQQTEEKHFSSTFLDQFMRRMELSFEDRLVSLRSKDIEDSQRNGLNRFGTHSSIRSIKYSLREMLADAPIWKSTENIFGSLIPNSIGNVDEELIDPKNPSFQVAEQSWWESLHERNHLRYGIRPFRTSPYIFSGFQLRDHGKVILFSDLRYHYAHFNSHKGELIVGVPIIDGLRVTSGVVFNSDPKESHHGRVVSGTIRLSQSLHGKRDHDNYLFVGADLGFLNRVVFGINKDW